MNIQPKKCSTYDKFGAKFSILGCVAAEIRVILYVHPHSKKYILGCHGNHAFSHNLFRLMFENNIFCFAVVTMNNLTSIRNCHRGER